MLRHKHCIDVGQSIQRCKGNHLDRLNHPIIVEGEPKPMWTGEAVWLALIGGYLIGAVLIPFLRHLTR